MARTWTEEELIADGFERVHTELDWYDGPRAGLADVDGTPHYFHGYDFHYTNAVDEYQVWPASAVAVALEREQWAIFVRWHARRKAGTAGTDGHPGEPGNDPRYEELEQLLTPYREVPPGARRLLGELRHDAGAHYRIDGPGYWFRWHTRS
ncbi:hypothetical protein [Micromonospora auratinigra]|uniref:Uncharacterized protein n=1 Tax=Micromonospora auratinigra TaxID=261654 RepID=A0A1A8Z5T9_9ACTN|nr:hypothetical protein [Micromonospora auratinigra]SBT39227.1 hypothetical protein GA0070611_0833 [Micromonospora auratinigra]